jgi:Transposase zinc-ribbon domain
MAQHFLHSAAARSLSPAKVMRMSDRGAENVFLRLRWPQTDGKPVCPRCGCDICYDCRRSDTQPRWRCKAEFPLVAGGQALRASPRVGGVFPCWDSCISSRVMHQDSRPPAKVNMRGGVCVLRVQAYR